MKANIVIVFTTGRSQRKTGRNAPPSRCTAPAAAPRGSASLVSYIYNVPIRIRGTAITLIELCIRISLPQHTWDLSGDMRARAHTYGVHDTRVYVRYSLLMHIFGCLVLKALNILGGVRYVFRRLSARARAPGGARAAAGGGPGAAPAGRRRGAAGVRHIK